MKNLSTLLAIAALTLGFSSCDKKDESAPTDFSGGCEAVDLGLSVKWASWNVGATKPEQYGFYFAWGETDKKGSYGWYAEGDYKWGIFKDVGPDYGMTKYNTADGLINLEADDDPAIKNWGTKWRTPTIDEIVELADEAKCEWTYDTARKGFTVKGKKTGNTIFLPLAGFFAGPVLEDSGEFGAYWSSSLNNSSPDDADALVLEQDGYGVENGSRFLGLSVRAVTEY